MPRASSRCRARERIWKALFERLTAANIVCSSRQDRQGQHFIRFSPHFYNTLAEVDEVLRVIGS